MNKVVSKETLATDDLSISLHKSWKYSMHGNKWVVTMNNLFNRKEYKWKIIFPTTLCGYFFISAHCHWHKSEVKLCKAQVQVQNKLFIPTCSVSLPAFFSLLLKWFNTWFHLLYQSQSAHGSSVCPGHLICFGNNSIWTSFGTLSATFIRGFALWWVNEYYTLTCLCVARKKKKKLCSKWSLLTSA